MGPSGEMGEALRETGVDVAVRDWRFDRFTMHKFKLP